VIIFKNLRYKNILSFGDDWTYIELNRHKTTLIQGKNGGGKSTMLDAMTYSLFGKPFRKINKTGIINYKNKKGLLCEIEFETQGVNFKVVRGGCPQVFEIWKDGVLLDQSSTVRDYQTILESDILHFNYNAFTQIVVLGKATYVSFMQLKTDDRRKFIEDMLQLHIFGLMNDVHRNNVSILKESSHQLKNEILILKEKISLMESHISKMEKENESKSKNHFQKIETDIKDMESELHNMRSNIGVLIDQLISVDITELNKAKSKLSTLGEYKFKLEEKTRTVKSDIAFFNSNNICPTCSQDITDETKYNKVEGLNLKINQLHNTLTELTEKSTGLSAYLTDINNKLLTNEDIKNKIDKAKFQISEKEQAIKKLMNLKKNSRPELTNLDDEYNTLQKLNCEYNNLNAKKSEFDNLSVQYDVSSLILKDTGIKRTIIKEFIPVINSIINSHLKTLGFFATFVLDENFNEQILARGMDEISYFNFSEGEKFRIDLAILMTWLDIAKLQNNMSCNVLFFDEILDGSLDEDGTSSLIDLLNSLNNINVFVISHSPDRWVDMFKSTIAFGKENGYSKMIEGNTI